MSVGAEPSAGLEFQNVNEIRGIDQRFIFTSLIVRKQTFVGTFSKFRNPLVDHRRNPELGDTLRRFRVQAQSQGIEQLI